MRLLPRFLVEWWEWRRLPRFGRARRSFSDVFYVDKRGRVVEHRQKFTERR